jgi:hypothetical protein
MVRRIRREPAARFLELPGASNVIAAPGLVPGDGDMDEPLQEVALLGRRLAPGRFQLFVRGEELAAAD